MGTKEKAAQTPAENSRDRSIPHTVFAHLRSFGLSRAQSDSHNPNPKARTMAKTHFTLCALGAISLTATFAQNPALSDAERRPDATPVAPADGGPVSPAPIDPPISLPVAPPPPPPGAGELSVPGSAEPLDGVPTLAPTAVAPE